MRRRLGFVVIPVVVAVAACLAAVAAAQHQLLEAPNGQFVWSITTAYPTSMAMVKGGRCTVEGGDPVRQIAVSTREPHWPLGRRLVGSMRLAGDTVIVAIAGVELPRYPSLLDSTQHPPIPASGYFYLEYENRSYVLAIEYEARRDLYSLSYVTDVTDSDSTRDSSCTIDVLRSGGFSIRAIEAMFTEYRPPDPNGEASDSTESK